MKKYKIYRCEKDKDINKNIKKHELIGVVFANDIDEAESEIRQSVYDDLIGNNDYEYTDFTVEVDEIMPASDSKRYQWMVLGVAIPSGSAPNNLVLWYGITEENF